MMVADGTISLCFYLLGLYFHACLMTKSGCSGVSIVGEGPLSWMEFCLISFCEGQAIFLEGRDLTLLISALLVPSTA